MIRCFNVRCVLDFFLLIVIFLSIRRSMVIRSLFVRFVVRCFIVRMLCWIISVGIWKECGG